MANKYEIITSGISGQWSDARDCQKHWMDDVATTLKDALAVCRSISRDGYGVRLFENGIEIAR